MQRTTIDDLLCPHEKAGLIAMDEEYGSARCRARSLSLKKLNSCSVLTFNEMARNHSYKHHYVNWSAGETLI